MKIVVATNNQHKMAEYRALFAATDIEIFSLSEVGITANAEENGTTYEQNAIIKAELIKSMTDYCVIADDSGLEISSLGDLPGITSARFASNQGGSFQANIEILRRMKGVKNRSACFVAVIALLNCQSEPVLFRGECYGEILQEPTGTDGFGYDPIFYSNEAKCAFATLSREEKNRFSHRGKAVAKLLQYLRNNKLI